MTKKLLISIIIPVYNAEKYLNSTINSVLNQSYKNFELLLVNDGSKDNSLNICKEYSTSDKRIRVINQRNKGPSEARNLGIENAVGEYIRFIDADDTIENNSLSIMVATILESEVDLVVAAYEVFQVRGKRLIKSGHVTVPFSGIIEKKEYLKRYKDIFKSGIQSSTCNKLYKSSIIKENNIRFNLKWRIGEDAIFNLDYLDCTNSIYFIEKSCYNYIRENSSSLMSGYKNKYFKGIMERLEKSEEFLKINGIFEENIKEIYSSFPKTLHGVLLNLFKSNTFSKKEIIEEIRIIVNNDKVQEIIKSLNKNKNVKYKFLFFILKEKRTILIYALYQFYFFKQNLVRNVIEKLSKLELNYFRKIIK